jgi:large subunit ribosomal protein L24
MSSKIRRGDNVVVLSGRDKGRRGAVLKVLEGDQVIVDGINKVKKHTRANPQTNSPGGIVDKEMPMPMGKVALWNPSAKKGDRVGFKTLADGKKVRFFKSNGEMIDA